MLKWNNKQRKNETPTRTGAEKWFQQVFIVERNVRDSDEALIHINEISESLYCSS